MSTIIKNTFKQEYLLIKATPKVFSRGILMQRSKVQDENDINDRKE